MPGRNTGQEKVFAFSIVYLTGCTPEMGDRFKEGT